MLVASDKPFVSLWTRNEASAGWLIFWRGPDNETRECPSLGDAMTEIDERVGPCVIFYEVDEQ